ncbi:tyrosine-protein phosphatase [Prevotella sp. AGR2160]|uniref:tyrosine-protein phosphatase n=1 Tax=Prevotella sp. AGR2160 TaxID=1280674 RepID=UPI00048FD189|nr:tyrosine-protein phosphatase [Prevotella sp. AGR2160]
MFTQKRNQIGKKLCMALLMLLMVVPALALNPTTADKKRCFMDDPTNKTITFLYCVDDGYWPNETITSAYVCGSFNGWKKLDDYKLSYDSESKCWYVTVPYDKVNIPGNSGQPEYKFVINGNWLFAPSWLTDGYEFHTSDKNMIIVFSTDDFDQIKKNSEIAGTVRPLKDFDLTKEEDRAAISNFRLVPGTTQLFRSYHPFKASRSESEEKYKDIDTEHARLATVDEYAAAKGIQSDICLSGDETNTLTSYVSDNNTTYQETIPAYYQKIIDNGNVLIVNANDLIPSYNYVYAKSNSKEFGDWMTQIVDFIISDQHPAPFQIHCRLGTDRTGVICGVIAGLCGASWKDIAADYQKSNNMQIREFRDYKLLAYSFRNMLGEEPSTISNLQQALTDYFVNNGYLTVAKIEAMRNKLNATTTGINTVAANTQNDTRCYNLMGQRVAAPAKGQLVIMGNKKVVK